MTKPFKATYEMFKATKNKVVFKQRMLPGQAVRDSELGYLYLTKGLWRNLGEPYVLSVQVTAKLPKEEDDEDLAT